MYPIVTEQRNIITIMFWNVNLGLKKNTEKPEKLNNINEAIIQLIEAADVSILVLAEYPYEIGNLSDILSAYGRNYKVASFVDNKRIKMLYDHRFKYDLVRDNRYSFVSLIKDELSDMQFLLSGVHLPSKLHKTEKEIGLAARETMSLIKDAEDQEKTEKSIILGDFNLNPFDKGLINCDSFHAVPVAEIVKKKKRRIVAGKKYQMFYNPMWNFLGDFEKRSLTYYYDNSGGIDNIYNNIYDQVLISAQMIDSFISESLSIVSKLPNLNFINNDGNPDKDKYSDHFPIIFSLKEEA